MKGTKHTPEQIIRKLRQAEKRMAGGATVGEVCRELEVSEAKYHRWNRRYGAMNEAQLKRVLGVSERRACQVLGQARATHRYESVKPEGDRALVAAMDELRQRYTRIGCRGVWIRPRRAGWSVNRKRVHRIWKAEGWQIRSRRRKRRGRGLSANSCAVRRAEHRGHVWSL